jgi:pSer/pThr/pTyr-binding forkhead associated (FHA) protein
MAVFSLMYNHKRLESFPIGMGDTFMIGRQAANDIVIDNPAVSFHHAKVESIGDEFLLIDLHSENGSFVNDQRIKAHWLVDGDIITIGKHSLLFSNPKNKNLPDKMSPSIVKTMQMDTEKFRELLNRNGLKNPPGAKTHSTPTPILAFLSERRKKLALGQHPVRIGKAPTSDIIVEGLLVGKTAAVINRLEDGWYLSYVGGLARAKVNGQIVKTAVKLNRLDVITLGKLTMQFVQALL